MNASPTVSPPRSLLLHPRLLLVGMVVAGLLAFCLFPRLQAKLGLYDYGRWFLDTYAILATNDAIHVGLDPYASNPLDDLQRPHSYSHWWFVLGRLGLTRADNFIVGGATVLAFLATALAALRPGTRREALVQAMVLLSPPVLLAIMRGNNDLVVFAVLAAGLLAAGPTATWRWLVLLAAVTLATGLKFYPAVAAVGVLLVRPPRRLWQGAALTGLVLAAVVANVWMDFGRAVIPVPSKLYIFGAALLLRDLGWTGLGATVVAAVVLAGLGVVFWRRGLTRGLTEGSTDLPDRLRFIMAAALLVACFLAGISYAYRWVFAIWLVPWLWNAAGPRRAGSRLALGLLLFSVWADGLLCLSTNVIIGPMSPVTQEQLQLGWRFLSQPFTWLLMGLLAGWLLDALVGAWRDWRREAAGA